MSENENPPPKWEQYLADWSTRGYELHIATMLAKADWSEDMINWQAAEINRLRTQLMDSDAAQTTCSCADSSAGVCPVHP